MIPTISAGRIIAGHHDFENTPGPNATLEEIGPSRGTSGDYDIQAGLDESGNRPPEQLTATLAAPAPLAMLCRP